MARTHLDDEQRLHGLRREDEAYDETVIELSTICEAEELTLFLTGDAV